MAFKEEEYFLFKYVTSHRCANKSSMNCVTFEEEKLKFHPN
jgi:hypothetical protein